MNKILIDTSKIDLIDEIVIIKKIPDRLVLNIKGNVYCGFTEFHNKELIINLDKNATLTIEFLITMNNTKNKIMINNQEKSQLDLHYACIYEGNNELVIENTIPTSNNKNNIFVRAVESSGNFFINATGIIEENTFDNTYLEDIKALTKNRNSMKIMPNLIVKSSRIIANHNATISPVDENDLFYLESKGLSNESATSLIKEGFLKGIVTNDELKSLEVKTNE